MDADRFDILARALTAAGSRRRAAALVFSGVIGLRGWLHLEATEAHDALLACKKKSGKQKKKCIKKAKQHNATHIIDGGNSGPCPGVDLKTDVNNCGICGRKCQLPHATAKCVEGTCVIEVCDPGFVDCTGDDGCETQLGTNEHCRSCSDVCGAGFRCDPVAGCIPNPETNCADGVDNDGDGTIDQADSDCRPVLLSVAVNPKPVQVGPSSPSTGTVVLSLPAISQTSVQLVLSSFDFATVPSEVILATGQSTGTFPVTGLASSDGALVTLSATLDGVTVTDQFSVVAE